ncbi:MAG TPA: hypothetical protein VGW10_03045 [Solirubrobacteraceae bacterium]|nr:hypothetical protein [Solirubrobacteraceae bacterium]
MRRPSPATAVAFLALCIALSGIAYAQSVAPDSVGPIELKEPSVSTKHVVNRSLRRVDFAKGQIPRGRRGEAGATNVVERELSGPDVAAGEIGSVTVRCEGDERATGGGGGFAGPPTTNDKVVETIPVGDAPPSAWRVTLFNGAERGRTPVAYVICASP